MSNVPFNTLTSSQRDDFNTAFKAVSENGWNLQWVSDRLKNNKEIVKTAVSSIGESLQYASQFNDDDEIVKISLEQNGVNLEFCSDRIKSDKNIVIECLKNNFFATRYISEELKDDIDIALLLVHHDKKMYLDKMSSRLYKIYSQQGVEGFIQEKKRRDMSLYLEGSLPNNEYKKQKKI